jgi:hypothetical protein
MEMTGSLMKMEWDDATRTLALRHGGNHQRLLQCGSPHFMQPVIEPGPAAAVLDRVEQDGDTLRLHYLSEALDSFSVTLRRNAGDAMDMDCRFTARRDMQINRIELFPAGTMLNMYRVINFRNRHFSEATWPELLLEGGTCETDTFSEDWQFAAQPRRKCMPI